MASEHLEDNLETLFLLEVLVDHVKFDKPPKEENLRETCVGFQFLRYPPLMVCEEDFVNMNDDEFDQQNVPFKSGKSLLFALPSLTDGDPNLGNIHLWITRRIGKTEKTIVMGSTDINLMGSFENLLQASIQQDICPLSKFIKNCFRFKKGDAEVGSASIFLRISCFGKLIVTQFQIKGKDQFNFRGLPGDKDENGDKRCVEGSRSSGPRKGAANPCSETTLVPGQRGMGGGGPGMYPGMGGMGACGGPGMGGMGPGMYGGMGPGMGGGMYGMQGPGMPFGGGIPKCPSTCSGPKVGLHGKKGTLPCGEMKCPAGACGKFPCSHASNCILGGMCPCSSSPGSTDLGGAGMGMMGGPGMGMMGGPGMGMMGGPAMGMMGGPGMGMMGGPGMGMMMGGRPMGGNECPVDRDTQVTSEQIASETGPRSQGGTRGSSKSKKGKGGKKGKGKK